MVTGPMMGTAVTAVEASSAAGKSEAIAESVLNSITKSSVEGEAVAD